MSTPPKKIEDIDTNFKVAAVSNVDRLCWIDPFDRSRVALRGLGWLEENYAARSFRRLPDRAEAPLNEGVQVLSKHPAGVFVSFATDSSSLSIRATVSNSETMMHMPLSGSNGVELYMKEGPRWLPVATGIPSPNEVSYERELFKDLPRATREFRLYLPLYRELVSLQIGLDTGANVTPIPAPEDEKPIFIYGTSITQGGCASTAGSDYVSLLGRMLDAETINFGFSGSGKGEPEMAELIREVDAEMFVLDFVPNCAPEFLITRLPRFVELLRETRPTVPIVLITNPAYNNILVDYSRYESIREGRDIMLSFYCRQREAGDRHLHLIDGFGIAPAGVTGTYVDGVHPTSAGFVMMAERLAPQIAAIRIAERQWLSRHES